MEQATSSTRGSGNGRLLLGRGSRRRREITAMSGVIVALHLVGWGLFAAVVLPAHYGALSLGVAITAYTLGVRHAFDADHIAAIDNTTRKLIADGQQPVSAGFFFAMGHSTVVFALGVVLTFAARAVFGAITDPHSVLASTGGIAGTLASGTFLYLIAALNVALLVGMVRVFLDVRRGRYDEAELESLLASRGMMFRIFGRLTRSITRTWQMYPVGALFGLGFDTASEVTLFAAVASTAARGMPWYAVLTLPTLFAAGMSLFDTLDGAFMNAAYGWAFARPLRKVYYNITITALSVAVAFAIGTIELGGLLGAELHLRGTPWSELAGFSINTAGVVIVALFVVTWGVSLTLWRFGRIEQRWTAPAPDVPAE
ncbi:MAG: HoxN/HupN/NixA family nickel/cobalt transporter [Actinobacteria bacterium]|nr:HoxN/HupN/NixA family nickel/cobalt transporter [Actinomycetota bacterium]